jgi:Zn-dependent peptidase ImmA (M78 family)
LWFAFFHEIAHILKHKKQLFLEGKKEFLNDAVLEEEADKFASETLIPAKYAVELSTLETKKSIKSFAKEIGIASGIIVGRMQHEKIIHYSTFNDLKVKYTLSDEGK